MKYREATTEDVPQIKKMCEDEGLEFPSHNEIVLVAEDEGEIKAIIGVKKEYHITPLIAKNPVAAARLWHMVEGILIQSHIKEVKSIVEEANTKHQGHLIKEGFACTETGKLIFTKEY